MVEVDVEPERVLHGTADQDRQLAGVEPEALVPPPGSHGETATFPVPEQLDRCCRGCLGRALHDQRRMNERDTHQVARAREGLVRVVCDHGEDAASLANLQRPEVGERAPDVSLQVVVEPAAVAAPQHDLAELQENAPLHGRRA
jgi:hypothetical protein